MSALLNAGLAAGTSLLGGLFQNKANSKAARDQFNYQDALNRNAFLQQRVLQDFQNDKIDRLNDRIDGWNRDIIANHSTAETRRSSEDTTASTGSIDFDRLVKDAEAAGFNPLTVLRAGGLAGYSTTNVRTTSNSTEFFKPARDLMTFHGYGEIPMGPTAGNAPVVQRESAINNALQAGLSAWQNFDRHAQARFELEKGLAQAQIRNFDSDTARNNRFGFSIPTYTAPTVRTSGGGIAGSVRSQQPAGQLGAVAQPTVGEVKVTNPHANLIVDPSQRDAASYTERYEEVAANAIGLGILVKDIWHDWMNNPDRSTPAKTATDAAGGYLRDMYGAMQRAWNNPALNTSTKVTIR